MILVENVKKYYGFAIVLLMVFIVLSGILYFVKNRSLTEKEKEIEQINNHSFYLYENTYRMYTIYDYSQLSNYSMTKNSSSWLTNHPRVKLIDSPSKYTVAVFEFDGDSNLIDREIKYVLHYFIYSVIISTGDDVYVPRDCGRSKSIFFVTNMNMQSNCYQVQIPYYTIMGGVPNEILTSSYLRTFDVSLYGNRTTLAGFAGSS